MASIRERELLERCLASLLPQCAEVNAEVVVARRASDRELEELRSGYQWISLVAGPRGAGIAELRAAGMAIATGDVVVIIEDDGEVSSDFLRRVTGLTAPPAPRSGTRGQGGT